MTAEISNDARVYRTEVYRGTQVTTYWVRWKVGGKLWLDRRSVVNPRQARALLAAVQAQQPSGPMLVAFSAVMYYAGLRPEEAINLRAEDVVLLTQARQDGQDTSGASCTYAAPRRTLAATGPMTAPPARAASSSTAQKATAASCRPIPS